VEAQQAAEVSASVAAAQAAIQADLELPAELLEQIATWEREQSMAETEWRSKQSRMHLEFEERKRRLQEQQLGQRKKLRESCDAALRPLYVEGAAVCADLERHLVGKLCRMCEHGPGAGVPQGMLPGALARVRALSFGQLDQPLRAPNCPSRSVGAVPVSSGILVTLEKLCDRNGIQSACHVPRATCHVPRATRRTLHATRRFRAPSATADLFRRPVFAQCCRFRTTRSRASRARDAGRRR
jgi:hypothetical protein